MDSFEKKIEEYRQELMRYAQKHGTVYGSDGSFDKAPPEPEEEITKPKEEKKYDSAFVSARPMPDEYDGNDDDAVITDAAPMRPDRIAPRYLTEEYSTFDEFLQENQKIGKLRVQAFASNQAFPIANAKITVSKQFGENKHIFAEKYTDIDGIVQNISLPTKAKELSLSAGGEIPFSTYMVEVMHPKFRPQIYENVPIFDSIESLQPAAMQPLNGTDSAEIIDEEMPML